jgi:cell division protein FtsB
MIASAHRCYKRSTIVQRVVAAYETRLADAKRESAGLRAALSQLEKEHRALVNEQARLLP